MKCERIASFVIVFAALVPLASAQEQLWLTQFGTPDTEEAHAAAPDGAGGVYISGFMVDKIAGGNFDYDAYLAHYDSSGTQTWFRQFGTAAGLTGISYSYDFALALAPDGVGGVYVTGDTMGNLGGVNPNRERFDVFLVHYDSSGSQTWATQFGTSLDEFGRAVAPDGLGGVYLGGFGRTSTGGSYGFLAHYDSAGTRNWYTQLAFAVTSLAPDGTGGVYIAGQRGSAIASLAHFSSAGTQIWYRQFGTRSGWNFADALAADGAGGVYIAGLTSNSLGGPNAGITDTYLAHYDSAGTRTWIRQFGTPGQDNAHALAPDGAGGVYVAGETDGNLGATNAGSYDAFLAHYTGDGTQDWMTQLGTDQRDIAYALAPDDSFGVYIAGGTGGDLGGPNAGGSDVFLARYRDSCYADCDQSTGVGNLDVFDFLCFQDSFVNSEPYACDCDTSTGVGVCDVFDFLCFQDAFVGGCP